MKCQPCNDASILWKVSKHIVESLRVMTLTKRRSTVSLTSCSSSSSSSGLSNLSTLAWFLSASVSNLLCFRLGFFVRVKLAQNRSAPPYAQLEDTGGKILFDIFNRCGRYWQRSSFLFTWHFITHFCLNLKVFKFANVKLMFAENIGIFIWNWLNYFNFIWS